MNFDIYIHPIIQPEGFSRIEIYLPDKTIKALTDFIDSRIDKRMNEMNETITVKLDGNLKELTKSLRTLNNSLKP